MHSQQDSTALTFPQLCTDGQCSLWGWFYEKLARYSLDVFASVPQKSARLFTLIYKHLLGTSRRIGRLPDQPLKQSSLEVDLRMSQIRIRFLYPNLKPVELMCARLCLELLIARHGPL